MTPPVSGNRAPEIVRTDRHEIAVERRGAGPAIVFCHGNSSSSRCFDKQLGSGLADRFQLVAIDLPGHGASPPAASPEQAYSVPGHAEALVAVASALDVRDAVFVGWSLGGHVLVEASPELPEAAGFLICGAPPIATFNDFARAATDDPALGAAFRADSSDDEIRAYAALLFRPGYRVPESFVDDFRRADPRARALLGASAAQGKLRDEVGIVAELSAPLAVVHGAAEQIVGRRYFDGVSMPTLWRGAVQEVPDAGHAAQWENPESFNRLLQEFALDCAEKA